ALPKNCVCVCVCVCVGGESMYLGECLSTVFVCRWSVCVCVSCVHGWTVCECVCVCVYVCMSVQRECDYESRYVCLKSPRPFSVCLWMTSSLTWGMTHHGCSLKGGGPFLGVV